jgi:citrate synthase
VKIYHQQVQRTNGLRNIVVADTKVSSIDTKNRRILYRGYDILDLVNHSTFEETAYLLLYDKLPNSGELDDFTQSLIESRTLPESIINSMRSRQTAPGSMHVTRMLCSGLNSFFKVNIIFQQNSFPRINKYHSSISTIKIMSTMACDKKRPIDSGKRESKPSFSASTDKTFMFSLVAYGLRLKQILFSQCIIELCLLLLKEDQKL